MGTEKEFKQNRYECDKCKAHILGEVLRCSVCGEFRDPLAEPMGTIPPRVA